MRSIVDTARAQSRKACLGLEALETRCVPANQITFNPASGLVSIQGTASADQAQVSAADGLVKVNLTYDPGSGAVTENASFAKSKVKCVLFVGGDSDDTFWNDTGIKSTAYGGAGSDYLEGGTGKDVLYGGLGDDTLVGFLRNDRLFGEAGDDALFGMQGQDVLDGGDDDDSLFGGTGSDQLKAGLGINSVDGKTDGPLATVASAPGSEKIRRYVDACTISAFEQAIIDLTNVQRRQAGLPRLRVNMQLVHLADHQAGNMVLFDEMAHVLPRADLPDLQSRLQAYDYSYSWAGENIAWGFDTAQDLVDAWMDSPSHRANILNRNFTEIGVSACCTSSGDAYIAQAFGRPA